MLHELAHAYVGTWLGDRTPRLQGRLTFNPIKHLDVWGSVTFLVTFLFFPFAFSWAKPVQVDTRNLKHAQRGMALVAVAGPITNFLIALGVLALIVHGPLNPLTLGEYWGAVVGYTISVNIILGVFNLIPIPPLDGSRIVAAFMPKKMYEDWSRLDQYAPIFILALFLFLQQPLMQVLGDASARVQQVLLVILGV